MCIQAFYAHEGACHRRCRELIRRCIEGLAERLRVHLVHASGRASWRARLHASRRPRVRARVCASWPVPCSANLGVMRGAVWTAVLCPALSFSWVPFPAVFVQAPSAMPAFSPAGYNTSTYAYPATEHGNEVGPLCLPLKMNTHRAPALASRSVCMKQYNTVDHGSFERACVS
jgi:hypothetical protein